tara:strand:+ start:114 stop:431 length:318 start_codon:yes stop_codon:yes gene_type:complete
MKEDIEKIKQRLTERSKLSKVRIVNGNPRVDVPIGICGAINVLYSSGAIKRSTKLFVQRKIKEKAKRKKKFYTCNGWPSKSADQFLWKPTNLKSRLMFLDKIQNA